MGTPAQARTARRRGFAVAAAAVVVASAAACSHSNGNSAAAAQDVLSRAKQAVAAAPSVHVTGSLLNDGQPTQLDVQVVGNDASGTIDEGGQIFQILRLGTTVYLKGNAAFYAQLPAAAATPGTAPPPAAGSPLAQDYVLVPQTDRFYALAQHFTSATTLFSDALPPGTPSENGQKTVAGRAAVVITVGGAEADIAADGPPYPIQVHLPSTTSNGGLLTFDFAPAAPPATPPPTAVFVPPPSTPPAPAATTKPAPSPTAVARA